MTGGLDSDLSGGGYIVCGNTNSTNVSIDNNEILARKNGAVSDLSLNHSGGNVLLNGLAGNTGVGTTSPAYKLDVNGGFRPRAGIYFSGALPPIPEAQGGKQQGHAGIVEAAQGAGSHRLGAVGDEKACSHHQEGAGEGCCLRGVRRLGAEEQQWNRGTGQRHNNGHPRHEAGAEQDRGKARATGGVRIAAAGGLPDADGGGKGDAEGNHEQDRRGLQGNLMGGQCRG